MTYNRTYLYLEARIAKDPELRFGKTGTAILTLPLVQADRLKDPTTGEWKDGDSSWYDAKAFGNQAELWSTIPKGTLVCIHGRFHMRYWEGQDGTRRSNFEILIEHLAIPVISEKTFFPEPDGTMVFRRSTRQPKEPPVPSGIEDFSQEPF